MIKLNQGKFRYSCGRFLPAADGKGYEKTIAYSVLSAHSATKAEPGQILKIKFDALASHDITYVGIIQTARAIGLDRFPVPYVLTNCHNSLCAVGGTINEDDHVYGLTAAKKYGGIYVPPHFAVIHTFMRENFAGGGKMILGSDSHTRYGALGTMAIGEGGPELVKQIIGKTYDVKYPEIVAVNLSGKPKKGVGPQDVALAIIGEVFKNGFVKNKVMEFVGEGIAALPVEYRNGIDVMTTETTCLSSVWETDDKVKKYLVAHGRGGDYKKLSPADGALYDGYIDVELDKIEPMIALPFHPSNTVKLKDLIASPYEILSEAEKRGRELIKNDKFSLTSKIDSKGRVVADQAIIAGCAGGTYDNIFAAARILKKGNIGDRLNFSIYCGSQPIYADLAAKGVLTELTEAGAVVKTSFCGPCFGAGDVPQNNGFSIRHTTRNFENREGSKPGERQIASVALMDARSIAATAANGGVLTAATDVDYDDVIPEADYSDRAYRNRVYNGFGSPDKDSELILGPNISDIPAMPSLKKNLIMRMVAVIDDPVTTTDELIPSGETSSYRSNPLRLAEFALSRKVPEYVARAKKVRDAEQEVEKGVIPPDYEKAFGILGGDFSDTEIGSVIFAVKPGDGSAREQAASSQRVLGGIANIANEYATKRYRSNLINWGMIPFRYAGKASDFEVGDLILIKDPASALEIGAAKAVLLRGDGEKDITLTVDALGAEERKIIEAGCLINYNRL